MERPIHFEIPFNEVLINKAFSELSKFVNVIEKIIMPKSKMKTKNITFSERLAFRIVADVDWTCTDFIELKKEFETILNAKHIGFDNLLTKKHCRYLKLKKAEVKEALSLWTDWRLDINSSFNGSNKESIELRNTKKNALLQQNEDLMLMHAFAKWSADDSKMKFGTFLHYGIPRAKISTEQIDSQLSTDQANIKLNSTLLRMPYNDDSAYEDSYANLSINTTASTTCDKTSLDPKNHSLYESLKYESLKKTSDFTDDSGICSPSPSKTFYYRKKYVRSINEQKKCILVNKKNNQKLERSLTSLNVSEQMNSTFDVALGNLKKNKDIEKQKAQINVVKGGIVTNIGNVYFPSSKTYKTYSSKDSFTANQQSSQEISFRSDSFKPKTKELIEICKKKTSVPNVNPVKGGLVTNTGNVYFPSKK